MSVRRRTGQGLLGKYFHIRDAEKPRYINLQGRVIGQLSPTFYLVQYFEWTMGDASDQRVHTLDEMLGWQFYDDYEWWARLGEESVALRRQEQERFFPPPPTTPELPESTELGADDESFLSDVQ